jgi:hypothetical protein
VLAGAIGGESQVQETTGLPGSVEVVVISVLPAPQPERHTCPPPRHLGHFSRSTDAISPTAHNPDLISFFRFPIHEKEKKTCLTKI